MRLFLVFSKTAPTKMYWKDVEDYFREFIAAVAALYERRDL